MELRDLIPSFVSNLGYFVRTLILVTISTAVIAIIVMSLWNWQLTTLNFIKLPIISFWQAFAVVGIIQFIRIKI